MSVINVFYVLCFSVCCSFTVFACSVCVYSIILILCVLSFIFYILLLLFLACVLPWRINLFIM